MSKWYVAVCQECQPILPVPFETSTERSKWVEAHVEGTDHAVLVLNQERAAVGESED